MYYCWNSWLNNRPYTRPANDTNCGWMPSCLVTCTEVAGHTVLECDIGRDEVGGWIRSILNIHQQPRENKKKNFNGGSENSDGLCRSGWLRDSVLRRWNRPNNQDARSGSNRDYAAVKTSRFWARCMHVCDAGLSILNTGAPTGPRTFSQDGILAQAVMLSDRQSCYLICNIGLIMEWTEMTEKTQQSTFMITKSRKWFVGINYNKMG